MAEYDAIIIGGGHNGLVCAGYLAKAGRRVLVLERRHIVGGAVVTEELVPGYRFDLGGSAHILIHHTPIVADLELEQYGLEYIDIDPLFYHPFPDGTSLSMYKDVDRTCQEIAKISEQDALRYKQFVEDWRGTAKQMVEAFLAPPSIGSLAKTMGYGMFRTAKDYRDAITFATRGYGPVLRELFQSEQLQAMVGWMAAQSGPPPSEPMGGPFALWHPMYHESGMKRPRGGSGMLTRALARMIEAHGGDVLVNAKVVKILTERGRAVGAETEDGQRYTARAVVSGAHIHTTLQLLDRDAVPQLALKRLKRSRIGNGFGMVVRYAMNELPNYTATPVSNPSVPGEHHRALQFVCPSLGYLERAYGDYLGGEPSRDPALIAMTFSAVDNTLAPSGKHTLFLWGQYFPFELARGKSWDDIGQSEADRMLNTLAQYAPNVEGAVIDQVVQTPLFLERTLGLLRGNVMHLEMSIDQMFALRPAISHSNYRGPIPGLFLTGASTQPGGGIMGAAGRNAAKVVERALGKRIWQPFRSHKPLATTEAPQLAAARAKRAARAR